MVLKCEISFILESPYRAEGKVAEFANSVDPDEVAHNEPLHLYLHYLLSSL